MDQGIDPIDLPPAATLDDSDIFVVSGVTGVRKFAYGDLKALLVGQINGGSALPTQGIVAATPEGAVAAIPGSTRFDSVARALYVKETGTGNTGWTLLLTL